MGDESGNFEGWFQSQSKQPPPAIRGVELGELLGQGAFGKVYRARHQVLDVDVAVKFVHALPDKAVAQGLAEREARLFARLDHPNLLRIHDAGRTGGSIYLVLEFMDGGSLAGKHQLPAAQLLDITRQLLSGLQALHEAGVLHRDIKPDNCLVRVSDSRVKLADLGIAAEVAASTQLKEFAGTFPYMAPELFETPPEFGPRSDLYALGITLGSLALAADPFPTEGPAQIMSWAQTGTRPHVAQQRSDLDPAFAALVQSLMSAEPSDRPGSAAEALAELTTSHVRPKTAPKEEVEASDAETIGAWVLGGRLHAGSNWHHYAATHMRTGALARIRVLQPGGSLSIPLAHFPRLRRKGRPSRDLGAKELVLAAAEHASRLTHDGILRVMDWGTHDGRVYVVTAPQGRTLQQIVESGGAVEEPEALGFGVQLADALAYMHDHRLVYQVVEPDTVVMRSDAQSIQLGWPVFCVPAGTPARDSESKAHRVLIPPHCAPEAFDHTTSIEPSTDVYGLGETLYFILAGRPAYDVRGVEPCVIAKQQPPAPLRDHAPTVTQPTAMLIASMFELEPGNRPTATEVRDELARIAQGLMPFESGDQTVLATSAFLRQRGA